MHDCTLTSLLVRDGGGGRSSTERDVVGISGESRLVLLCAQADLDDQLSLSRGLLKRLKYSITAEPGVVTLLLLFFKSCL